MKKPFLSCCLCLIIAESLHAQNSDRGAYGNDQSMFGMGVQIASTTSLLFSWQSADQNAYGRSWRLEPMIGFSSSDNEYSGTSNTVSETLTLGLGAYMRWKVRAPFDNLYFTMGPRAMVTAYSTSTGAESYVNDTLQYFREKQQHWSSNLSIVAGPEYAIDQWSQHFSVAGYFSAGATITGRTKIIGGPPTSSTWSLTTTTGTGIILRYYFM